jgi:hypothetical protein
MTNLWYLFTNYVRKDWASSPLRTILELYGWAISTVSSLVFAFTVPHPPFMFLYPAWLSALFALTYCAFTRGSVGMVALNVSMIIIDLIGFGRLLAMRFL